MIALIIATIFAALFSILFKIFQLKGIDSKQAIVFNYVTAFVLGVIFSLTKSGPVVVNPLHETWVPWALALGIFFYLGMIFLSFSTKISGVAVSTVASRASMIIPITVCFLFIVGSAQPKWVAIAVVLVGLALTVYVKGKGGSSENGLLKAVAPLTVFVCFGITNSGMKLLQNHIASSNNGLNDNVVNQKLSMLSAIIFMSALIVGTIVYFCGSKASRKPFKIGNLVGGVCLGTVNYFCTYTLMIAMKSIDSSLLFPFHNVGIVAIGTLVGWLCFKEKLSLKQILGMIIAVAAICWMYI